MSTEISDSLLNELFILETPVPEKDESGQNSCLANIYSAFSGKVVLAIFYGSIGLPCLERFDSSLRLTLTGNSDQIVISLENVIKLSRSAVGELTSFAAEVLGRKKQLYLLKASTALRQRLTDLALTSFFQFLETDDELISILPTE